MRQHHWLATTVSLIFALPLLSCGGGRGGSNQAPGPTITFATPSDSSYVHGTFNIQVTATGAGKISTLKFVAPPALTNIAPTLDPTNRSASLTASLDVSTYADGPIKVSVEAQDELGGKSDKDLALNVAQKQPIITISSPSDQSTAKGTAVAITASASGQNGATITSLQLVSPPPGVGSNSSPSAGLFAAVWDTTQAPDGDTAIHFQATDSTGLTSDSTVHVNVNNKSAGQLTVKLSAGTTIQSAAVNVYAVDNTTTNVVTTAGSAGLLGAGTTDANGTCTITITDKNYSGPIEVTAGGIGLIYDDPSQAPPISPLSIPSNFLFESYIANYTAGTSLTLPLTLWTTLADHAARAVVNGRHPNYPGSHTLSFALADATSGRDRLFIRHFTTTSSAWDPSTLRSTMPAFLTDAATTSITDKAYAEFGDTALNELAHELSMQAGWSASSRTINGVTLVQQQLIPDLDADGQFNGKGESGAPITIVGASSPLSLTSQTMRIPLATALDNFISNSAVNLSGITRSDLMNAGVYDTISNDNSDLFSDPPSGSFDNSSPSCTIGLTYVITGGARSPVGSQKYVGGIVTLTADCTDNSGVQSVTASVGSQALSPVQGNTNSHYSGTWDTTSGSDGALTFSVTSKDVHNNQGVQTVVVTVDNTKPTVSVAANAPTPGAFYSGSVPFDVTASDAGSGVASLTPAGFTGLTASVPSASHFVGTWSVPSGTSDGAIAGSFTGCDAVGNCLLKSVSVNIDQTPPVMALVTTPPAASNGSVSVTVSANDGTGSGVGSVLGTVNGNAMSAPQNLGSGQWKFSFTPVDGQNYVQIWAVDATLNAVGSNPNSGLVNGGASYLLKFTVMGDHGAPSLSYDGAFASYVDERNMNIATNSSGDAVTPPQYSYTTGKVGISNGGNIYKTAARLAWTSAPTDLEGSNANNIPTLRWAIPCDPNTQAPINSVTYSISASCTAGCTGTPALGSLWTSTTANNYILPLSSNLIPDLATGRGPITLSVTVTATDAAGNSTTTNPYSFIIHVLNPSVAVRQDTLYSLTGDSKSAYPYSGATYSSLYNAGLFAADGVRLQHFIVTNPTAYYAALATALTGSPQDVLTETWTGGASALANQVYRVCSGAALQPCSALSKIYYSTGGTAAYACGDKPPHGVTPATGNYNATAGLSVVAYQSSGAPAAATPQGAFVIPPASNGVPGKLDIYVTRPFTARPSGGPALNWNGTGYTNVVEDAYAYSSSTWKQECCTSGCGLGNTVQVFYYTWTGARYASTLSASEAVAGSLSYSAETSNASNSDLGELIPGSSYSVATTITH